MLCFCFHVFFLDQAARNFRSKSNVYSQVYYYPFLTYLFYLCWGPRSHNCKDRKRHLNHVAQREGACPPNMTQSPFSQETRVKESKSPLWQDSNQRDLYVNWKQYATDGRLTPLYSDHIIGHQIDKRSEETLSLIGPRWLQLFRLWQQRASLDSQERKGRRPHCRWARESQLPQCACGPVSCPPPHLPPTGPGSNASG